MQRRLWMILALVLLLGTYGCSGGSGDDDESPGDDDTTEPGDDDTSPTGDDDSSPGDDDDGSPGDDDDGSPGDDDDGSPGDDDDGSPGDDDDGSPGDDDDTPGGETSVPAADATDLDVANDSGGDVMVVGDSSATEVTVKADFHDGSSTDYADVAYSVVASGTAVQVVVDAPAGSPVRVDLEIHTPNDLVLHGASTDGKVIIDGMVAGIDVASNTGDVTGTALTGDIEVATTDAEVELTTTIGASDSVQIGALQGGIKLHIPTSTNASFDAATGDGDIKFNNINCTCINTSGLASGTFGSGTGGTIDLSTNVGDIEFIGY